MSLYEFAILAAILVSGVMLGVLIGVAYMQKRGYTETGLMKVGYCVLDEDDNVLGYAKGPDDYAAIMQGKEYASAAPMFIKIEQ